MLSFVKIKKKFKVNKLFVTEACLHIFIYTCICTCFLCAAVKNGKIIFFVKTEVQHFQMLVSNTQVDTCWIVSQEVKSSNPICVCFSCFVFFLTAFSFSAKKKLRKGAVCVCVS